MVKILHLQGKAARAPEHTQSARKTFMLISSPSDMKASTPSKLKQRYTSILPTAQKQPAFLSTTNHLIVCRRHVPKLKPQG